MKCPYYSAAQGRCATTNSGRFITECTSCGRVVEERQSNPHLRSPDNSLCLITSDLPTLKPHHQTHEAKTHLSLRDSLPPSQPGPLNAARSSFNHAYPSLATSRRWSAHLNPSKHLLLLLLFKPLGGSRAQKPSVYAYVLLDLRELMGESWLSCTYIAMAFPTDKEPRKSLLQPMCHRRKAENTLRYLEKLCN
ncbi:Transcription initiation factor IIB [Quillaja saponaria]|uniref:Transcription initiation factor IIB n=1 Tax=Quillaja saponaria TaxID=32244 RepID=A0AAD7L908_QUISA|nr:Transcription initiation factor IIB [Quillaja saponaria]